MSHEINIGALAKRTQCQAETIRYYEREGLLPPPARSQGNYRQYDTTHVERLSFIRHCRSLDMTLDEIRALLDFRDAPTGNCAEVSALLDEHVRHVADRIAQLRDAISDVMYMLVEQCAYCGAIARRRVAKVQ